MVLEENRFFGGSRFGSKLQIIIRYLIISFDRHESFLYISSNKNESGVEKNGMVKRESV